MTYTESQIRSICECYPDLMILKPNAIFIAPKLPLFKNNYIVSLLPVSNNQFEVYSYADSFMFINNKISCEYSMFSAYKSQIINYDYTFNFKPNNLNEYLKYFHEQLPLIENEYKKFVIQDNLDKIKKDFIL